MVLLFTLERTQYEIIGTKNSTKPTSYYLCIKAFLFLFSLSRKYAAFRSENLLKRQNFIRHRLKQQ
jgi:hypothetical protein